jgi:glutaredoxin 3
MAKVVIYTKNHCPFCIRAKQLLQAKGVDFEEHNMEDQAEELEQLKNRTGLRTVPQIFINDQLIGGFTDLAALDSKGELDKILAH